MKILRLILGTICSLILTVSPTATYGADSKSPRLELAADFGWKFTLGNPKGAESSSYLDKAWRTVDLPHDWSIEGRPDKSNLSGSGGGFFPTGIGWYRRAFAAPADWQGKRVSVEFDGVYRHSTVYLNGHEVGTHANGYTSFAFDVTPDLNFNGPNVLAVRADNSEQPNSRWYSGSGIYRHVRLVVTDQTHIAHWGVFVSTPDATDRSSAVSVKTNVANDSAKPADVMVETTLYDQSGLAVGKTQSPLLISPGKENEVSQTIVVSRPALWSPATPTMYRAVSHIRRGGKLVDEVVTPFGIRSLAWSAEHGLLLNGKPIKLTGGSVHHDNGPLGAAAFDRAEERKVEILKASGHNAVRTAHNAPSPAFLDACDKLGLLVLDEPFDTWKANKAKFDYGRDFDEWWKRDVSSLVMRDRNHPSVVIWGIGNEIPELVVERGEEMGKQIAEQVRLLDGTRPLTLAFPGTTTLSTAEAVLSKLDITGYNYNILATYAADHQKLPKRIMLTTESYPPKAFPLWAISQDNSYVIGDLAWTSMDYLGESGIGAWTYGTADQSRMAEMMNSAPDSTVGMDQLFTGITKGVDLNTAMAMAAASSPAVKAAMDLMLPGYPWHSALCGDIDLTGLRKPQSYYRDILWNGGDRVYATVRLPEPEGKKILAVGWAVYPTLPSWTWPGEEGKNLQVEVYSGAETVQLFLNDKLIGEKQTGRDQEFRATFSVPYASGTLKAVGLRGGRPVTESVLTTSGDVVSLRVTADRTVVDADGQDLSYVVVEAIDAKGHLQPHANQEVEFSIAGPGLIAAVGNGDAKDDDSYQGDRRKLFNGRALAIIRTSRRSGPITLTARSPGLNQSSVTIRANEVAPRAELH